MLSWSVPSSGGSVSASSIEYRVTGTTVWLSGGEESGAQTFTLSGLQASTSYDFVTTATNNIGSGPISAGTDDCHLGRYSGTRDHRAPSRSATSSPPVWSVPGLLRPGADQRSSIRFSPEWLDKAPGYRGKWPVRDYGRTWQSDPGHILQYPDNRFEQQRFGVAIGGRHSTNRIINRVGHQHCLATCSDRQLHAWNGLYSRECSGDAWHGPNPIRLLDISHFPANFLDGRSPREFKSLGSICGYSSKCRFVVQHGRRAPTAVVQQSIPHHL